MLEMFDKSSVVVKHECSLSGFSNIIPCRVIGVYTKVERRK